MTPEQMQKIVDGAPRWALSYCDKAQDYFEIIASDFDCCSNLCDLRAELAKHETLDLEPADIPHGCIVLEK